LRSSPLPRKRIFYKKTGAGIRLFGACGEQALMAIKHHVQIKKKPAHINSLEFCTPVLIVSKNVHQLYLKAHAPTPLAPNSPAGPG